jgi:class 3 adenylate cyclase/predicted ATPase
LAGLKSIKCPSCQAELPAGNRFCGECGAKLPTDAIQAPVEPSPSPQKPAPAPAERRQLTVMFCDLVGSTALSARMDPEDLRGVIGAYHRCVAEIIARFQGFVAKYMGDGVLVYFGYPGAQEDDVERAVQAGLALVGAVERLPISEALRVRIGIATGLVVVGDLIGSGASLEQAVVGETPNLAARLQGLAEPGTVVVAETTRRLLAGLYEYEDLEAIKVKGFAEPIRAWRVLRESAIESRFEALRSGETPLVGRDEELNLLTTRWQQAKGGDGQVVLVSGEPGIGKSRLIATFLDRVQQEPHVRLRYFCTPHHRDSALFPFIAQLERAARFERADTAEARFAKLEALLKPTLDGSSEPVLVLAELLSVPILTPNPQLVLSPQQKKGRTLEALLNQLDGLARKQPVLMVFEDLQWIDPTSRELLEQMVKRVASLPTLLITTFRPEFKAPWEGFSYVTLRALNRLTQSEAVSLIERVTGGKALPPEVLDQIMQRTDGVPLFIEELTKAVLEGGMLQEQADRYTINGPLPSLAIPNTLQASLMARLDRLASAKDVAQIGAVIGREFSHDLLAAVAGQHDQDLQSALDRLIDSGLILCQSVAPTAVYTFKHALIQDAAYATLLRSRRIDLHARIAHLLEASFPEMAEAQPELLARHYSEAGLGEPAIAYWQRAGERAIKRSANLEAVAHFRRGLEALEALPDRTARTEQELRLLIGLGPALMLTRSSIAPEITQAYGRARQLASELGKDVELFKAVWGLTFVANIKSDLTTSRQLNDELFEIARRQDNPDLLLQAHHAAWGRAVESGEFIDAQMHIEAGLVLYRREVHGQDAHIYGGHDPGTCAYSYGAQIACILGHSGAFLRMLDQSLALARDLAHPPTLADTLAGAASIRVIRRESLEVEELIGSLLPLVSRHGSAVGMANVKMLHGWALVARGRVDEGLVQLRLGLGAWRASGSTFSAPFRLGRAADAYRMAGQPEEAMRLVIEATETMDRTGERWFEAELHRLRGQLLMDSGDHHQAENCFRRAIEVARSQSARLFELRSANNLGQLWRSQGHPEKARELLAPLFAWFADGFDTVDLKEAKALLDALC